MKSGAKYLLGALCVCFFIYTILISVSYKKLQVSSQKISKELEVSKNTIDSLHAELFPALIELNRYEISFSILSERNPKAALEFSNIMTQETE